VVLGLGQRYKEGLRGGPLHFTKIVTVIIP